MIEATQEYIKEHGIPKKRKVSFLKRWRLKRKYR
jgi:hypothetical protein